MSKEYEVCYKVDIPVCIRVDASSEEEAKRQLMLLLDENPEYIQREVECAVACADLGDITITDVDEIK